jgi:carbon monoxide dehydrogenase subunit G
MGKGRSTRQEGRAMGRTTATRTIHAPIERVFDTVAHIENFSKAVSGIVKVEHLSDVKSGVGTRFRETRLMGRREASTELEVTEYVENDHVRLVTDAGGTIWDTVFTVRPVSEGSVELTMVMDANAHKFLARLMNPLIKGIIRKAIERDMDAVKAHCEGRAG